MNEFFDRPMACGRYAQENTATVFAHQRQYFDQILYKNRRFRHEYALAFQQWATAQGHSYHTRRELLLPRIKAGIHFSGEEKIQILFSQLLNLVRTEFPDHMFAATLSCQDTLPGGALDTNVDYAKPMERFRRFWTRVALAEVWEEEHGKEQN